MEEYIQKSGKTLRLGYTTGTCATLAAKAAATILLSGKRLDESRIVTPRGISVNVPIENLSIEKDAVQCAVRKDAGDDPDITDGILVYARVEKSPDGRISVDGGSGVGRVTRKGLDQPVGAAAINRVPRKMIGEALETLRKEYGYNGGLSAMIEIPRGQELAAKTFNPQLGIVGGLSIIGTSGIVEPMSTQALLDTIDAEMRMHKAEGEKEIILTPGNYGERYLDENPDLAQHSIVKCSNFIGEALDMAVFHGFDTVLIVGHIGKLVKLAGGIMDTHSKIADCRMELLALHTALSGGEISLLDSIMASTTTDAALSFIAKAGLQERVIASLLEKAEDYIARRTKNAIKSGVLTFSFQHGYLGVSQSGHDILGKWKSDSSG